jgi:hypothetical protein
LLVLTGKLKILDFFNMRGGREVVYFHSGWIINSMRAGREVVYFHSGWITNSMRAGKKVLYAFLADCIVNRR